MAACRTIRRPYLPKLVFFLFFGEIKYFVLKKLTEKVYFEEVTVAFAYTCIDCSATAGEQRQEMIVSLGTVSVAPVIIDPSPSLIALRTLD